MKEIQLTQGKVALVDDEDFEKISKWKWHFSCGYAKRNITVGYKKQQTRKMHWDVIGKPEQGMVTDHINGDGLDNRKENLRICTHRENMRNSRLPKNNKSGYKGVHWASKEARWVSQISVEDKCVHLGSYENIKDAVEAYNKGAKKYHGEYASLNTI